jgi:hypothetical protein
MNNVWILNIVCLALLLVFPRNLRAQVLLPRDGDGVEVDVQLEVALGPTLSIPPPLPIPVLPGSRVRFRLNGLSNFSTREISWTKDGVSLGNTNELVIGSVRESDTGPYLATVTTTTGDVIVVSRVLHVSAFPRQRLLNLSTRARVSFVGQPVIAGFVVYLGPGDASSSKLLLIRAVGPSLAEFGVTDALADPTLQLFRSDGTPIEVSPSLRDPDRIADAAVRTGASALRRGASDAGLLLSLRGGVYTAQVSSTTNKSGEVLVEIYEVPR